jgi:hypothetical protein
MDEWLDRVADALDEPRITQEELGTVLKLAREVAHRVERRFAPVSAFLVGVAVGKRASEGRPREETFRTAVDAVRDLLPPSDPPGD